MASELRNTLVELVRRQASMGFPTSQQTTPIAQSILSPRVGIKPWRGSDAVETEDIRGPSPINRLIDVLSRPLYGIANPIKFAIESEDQTDFGGLLSSVGRGLAGKDKTLGADVLEAAGMEHEVGRGIAGFGLDVLLDPLTYVGVGLVKNLGKGITKSVEALTEVEDTAGRVARDLVSDIETAAATGAKAAPERVFHAGPGRRPIAALTTGTVSKETPRRLFEGRVSEPPTHVGNIQSVAVAGANDTIAAPIPKPQSGREILEDLLQDAGPGHGRMIEKQLRDLPQRPVAGRQSVADMMRDMAKAEKSPPIRNLLQQQIRKVEANVNPAETLVGLAGRPIQRPSVKATPTQRAAADEIGADFLKVNRFDEITPPGQQRLLERIQNRIVELKVPKKNREVVALNMLRQAEETVLRAGRKLVDNQGNSVRLSDIGLVAGKMNTTIADTFRLSKPSQPVEVVRARSAETVADEIINPIVETASKIKSSVSDLPPARTAEVKNDVVRELSKIALAAGASKHEAGRAKQFISELFDFHPDELISEARKQAVDMMRISVTGKANATSIHAYSKAVYDSLGGNPKAWSKITNAQPKVVEAIMLRLATQWDAKDLRPFAREYIDSARNFAAAFEKAMAPIVRATTVSQRNGAWQIATGKLPPSGNAADTELANRFSHIMERLLGAEGVRTNAGNSVVTRAGVTMEDLNKELARGNSKLQFNSKHGTDDFGRDFDYTEENWLNSWKSWDVKEPAEAMYEVTRALQLVTRKNALLDDAAARFALPIKSGEFNTPVAIPRLDGFYFPKELADQLNIVWRRINDERFNPGGVFLQNFDKVQRAWKSGVTIYSPSHHIRNLNGDVFLNMLDGVMFTRSYITSAKVLMAHRRRYRDLESAINMTDAKWRRVAAAQPGDIVLTTKGGHKLTNNQLMIAAEEQGFLLKTAVLEDLIEGARLPIGLPGKARGRLHGAAASLSENRDHWVRLAHFIELVKNDKSKNLRDVFTKAGHRVKKFHPDGSDLTAFEQNVMRRLGPFYSWLRKATPLIIEGMVMRPHISVALPKAMSAIQEMTGVESEGPGNPFPVDSMFPDWIKEKGIGPVLAPDHPLAGIGRQETWRGEAPGYTIIDPTSPFIDQMKEVFNPMRAIENALTPGLKLPMELLKEETSLGIPLEHVTGGTMGHLLQQVPPVGIGARITGMTRPDEPYHPEQLINWLLTGGLVKGTGPYKGQAQFEIRELLEEMGRKERERLY